MEPRIVTGYIGPMHEHDMHHHRQAREAHAVHMHDLKGWRVGRLNPEEMVRLAFDIVQRKVLTSHEVVPFDEFPSVFPGAIKALGEMSAEAVKEIGVVYEYLDKAVGKASNGQPAFLSAGYLHREDWERVRELALSEVLRQERV